MDNKNKSTIMLFTEIIDKTRVEINNSKYVLAEKSYMNNMCKDVVRIGKTGDISEILSAERDLLRWELDSTKPTNPSALVTSLNNAIRDLDKAENTSNLVRKPGMYKEINNSISEQNKDRINGLPKDAFHRFIDSNKTRLMNRFKTPELTHEERKLIEARYSNMNTIKKEYIKLQEQALDITPKTKTKELER